MKFQTLKGEFLFWINLGISNEAPTPPHEEVPATSPEQEVQLDDLMRELEDSQS